MVIQGVPLTNKYSLSTPCFQNATPLKTQGIALVAALCWVGY